MAYKIVNPEKYCGNCKWCECVPGMFGSRTECAHNPAPDNPERLQFDEYCGICEFWEEVCS